VTVTAEALSAWNAVEERYDRVRGLKEGGGSGCQAKVEGDVVIDVPPESQVHRQVVRKAASDVEHGDGPGDALLLVEVAEPDMHEPRGDFERLAEALREQWGVERVEAPLPVLAQLQPALRKGEWQVTVALWRGRRRGRRASWTFGRGSTRGASTGSPSTWAPPPSRRI
jgi:uncharacterized 2Fe-2S/4Fe-4S cluster protein (DUF4445 family)